MTRITHSLKLVILATVATLLVTCSPRVPLFAQIDTLGVLRVATVNSAFTYYLDAGGATGLEHDLVRRFADQLGVDVSWQILANRQAVFEAVASRSVHMAVGLPISDTRRERVRFTPPYRSLDLEVVYRSGTEKPNNLADLSGRLTLPGHTALVDWFGQQHPDIEFEIDNRANAEELMDRVASGGLDATIANADLVAMNQRYYPSLRVAFKVQDIQERTAWAFAPAHTGTSENTLYNQANDYLAQTRSSGRMDMLHDRYFGHIQRLGFVGGQTFAHQVDTRLDQWRDYFKRAGEQYGLDWRLLAATGYQESHWDKNAVSPTTVRGIMMLTEAAASEVGVRNRRNPQQSINGGARYLVQLLERLPEEITEPDRTWFALAAYNIGYGHVMDARRLLKARNRDPNLWINLRDALPWLTQDRYLSETRYGYARGLEAKAYVGNIRAYYDILVWMTNDRATEQPEALSKEESAGGAEVEEPASITIDSPAF